MTSFKRLDDFLVAIIIIMANEISISRMGTGLQLHIANSENCPWS